MISEDVAQTLRSCISADPQLPRPNPTASFWQEPPHPTVSNAQSPVLPETTDFAIIGSGITGCSVTKTLLEDPSLAGKRITVLEARLLCSSATGRNGGHLVSNTPEMFGHMAAMLGIEHAKDIARFSFASIERLKSIVAGLSDELKEKTQLREVTCVTAFGDIESLERFKASLDAFDEALPELRGRTEVVYEEEMQKRFKFRGVVGAELQKKAGALWPYRLITGIFEMLLKAHPTRFSIETSTPVIAVSHSEDPKHSQYPYTIKTPRGTIRAARVIHCTNGHAAHLLPILRGKIAPFRGTMSVQARNNFPNLAEKYSWSYADKGILDLKSNIWSSTLYYITQDPNSGDIYIGGEKVKIEEIYISDDTTIGDISGDTLAKILPKLFREGFEEEPVVKKMWSGIMGFTTDWMPLVGRLSKSMTARDGDGEWIAAGYSGHGMDKSWLTGEALAGMITGKDVSSYFPSAYLITDERLKAMDLNHLIDFVGSAGS